MTLNPRIVLVPCAFVAALAGLQVATAQENHWPLVYEGTVTSDAGTQVSGPLTMTFRIYDSPQGRAPLWSETLPDVDVLAGDFIVFLGQIEPLPTDVEPTAPLFLGLQIGDDEEQSPRMAIGATLRARFADLAERARSVTGGVVDARELRVGGSLVIDDAGRWVGASAPNAQACWDTNSNGRADPQEDVDGDGQTNVADCRGAPGLDSLASVACAVGEFIVRTPEGWGCDAHAADPAAHHSPTSDGLVITPASVRVGDNTALSAGEIRLGPEAAQVLTAGMLTTLTGGGVADALHTHAGQAAPPTPGKFLGLTAAAFNGNMGGRFGVDAKCSAEFPNSHQCSHCEVLDDRPTSLRGAAWVITTEICNPGVQSANVGCAAWRQGQFYHREWTFGELNQIVGVDRIPMSGGAIVETGEFARLPCNSMLPIACCAN